MIRGVKPVTGVLDVAMFDRVVMDVFDVVTEVRFIANGMLPIAALPDVAFTPVIAADGGFFGFGQLA